MKLLSPNTWFSRGVAILLIPAHLGMVCADTVGVGGLTTFGKVMEDFVPDFVAPPPLPEPPTPLVPPVVRTLAPQRGLTDLPKQPANLDELRTVPIFDHMLCVPEEKAKWDIVEGKAFSELLQLYGKAGARGKASNELLLANFAKRNPRSPFLLNVHVERGGLLWQQGRFIAARDAFHDAWVQGRLYKGDEARNLAEIALGELLLIEARLGHKDELKALLEEVKERPVGGHGRAYIDKATEILWFIEHRAEQNIFCGFTALNAVCVPRGQAPTYPDVHDEAEQNLFINQGISAFDLKEHNAEVGGNVKVIRRIKQDAPPPVPSVVHWHFGHFSALTEKGNEDRIRVTDGHLKFDEWVNLAVIHEQTSGTFIIPGDLQIPQGYSEITDQEAKSVRGRHCTHSRDLGDSIRASGGGNAADCAMATYSFTLLDAGLKVQDTPISYTPPRGYPTAFKIVYDQRNTASLYNPGAINVSHVGPRWGHSYQGYMYRSSVSSTAATVTYVTGTGEVLNYTYNSTLAGYKPAKPTYPQLQYVAPGGYRLTRTDGSTTSFMQPGSASNATRFFLTAMADQFGNTTTFAYDSSRRLTQITDAMGQTTVLGYVGSALQIRTVTDPFGRQASFTYSSTSNTGLLLSITDPMGIVSSFTYGTDNFVTSITTPYGETLFKTGRVLQAGNNSLSVGGQYIEATDSVGDRERVESVDLPSLPFTDNALAPTSVTVGGSSVSFLPANDNLFYRNTFQWDKKQMNDGHGPDYKFARVYNWLAADNAIVGVLGSVKEPLEGRTWFNYPGQVSPSAPGTNPQPSKVVRQVEQPSGGLTWVMSQARYDNPYGLSTGGVDEKGRETRITYHTNNLDPHLIQVKDGSTWRTLKSFDSYVNHAPTQITDASGVVTTMDYNVQGQLLSMSVTKVGQPILTTRYTYDSDVNSDGETDGYLIKQEQTDPVNPAIFVQTSLYTYEPTGSGAKRVKTATDERGYTITYTSYDNFDRPTVITYPDGSTEKYVYERLELVATKARNGTWRRARFNHAQQLIVSQDSLGRVSSFEWCRCGQLKSSTDPLGRTTRYVRDIQGRTLEKILPDNSKFSYSYEPQSGRLESMRMPKDAAAVQPTVAYKYDLDGRMLEQDYSDLNTPDVSFTYSDYLGRLTSHTDQLGTTNYAYHPLDGSTPGAGYLASVNGPWDDDTIFYHFDEFGRPKKQQVCEDVSPYNATHSVEMSHDGLNRLTSAVNALGTFTYNYTDVSARVTSISTSAGGGFSQTFAYHPVTTPGAGGEVAEVAYKVGSTTISAFNFSYNVGSRLRTLTEQLGPNALTDTRQWDYRYSDEDEITDATLTQPPGGTVIQQRSWQHDATGNRVRESSGNASKLAWHNLRNQVTQIGGGGKSLIEGTLDELGTATVKINGGTHQSARMTSLPGGGARFQKEADFLTGSNTVEVTATDTSANVTTQNYIVNVDPVAETLTYDDNGNLQTQTVGGVIKLFEWDAKNRMIAVQSADPPVNGSSRSEFEYDGLDRRVRSIEKIYNGTSWIIQSNVTWLWIGDEICQQRESTGSTPTRSYYAEGMMIGSTPYLQTTDHLGNPRELLDGFTGALEARYHYDTWGTRTKSFGSGADSDFGFTGHLLHGASGLLLAKHRAYDTLLGRWISADPLGEAAGLNLYSYLGGDITNAVDPLGLFKMNWGRFGWGLAKGVYWGVVGLAATTAAVAFLPATALVALGTATVALTGYHVVRTAQRWHCMSDDEKSELVGDGIGGVLGGGLSGGLRTIATKGTARIGATGKVGEDALKRLGGTSQQYFKTSSGGRYVDQLVNGIANEGKTGYMSLTPKIRAQVIKDVALLKSSQVQGVIWNFYRSPKTGKIGPSGPLGDFLNANGIPYIIHLSP